GMPLHHSSPCPSRGVRDSHSTWTGFWGADQDRAQTIAAFAAEVRAIEDQWHEVFGEGGGVFGVSFWDSRPDLFRAVCERHGISRDDPRVFSIAAYLAERQQLERDWEETCRANKWENTRAGTPEEVAAWKAHIRWQRRLTDCRARHFPQWDGSQLATVDTLPKLWAHLRHYLLIVRESSQRVNCDNTSVRPKVCERDVVEVYEVMHNLKIPWTPTPPYHNFTALEANHELMRIANRLEQEERELLAATTPQQD